MLAPTFFQIFGVSSGIVRRRMQNGLLLHRILDEVWHRNSLSPAAKKIWHFWSFFLLKILTMILNKSGLLAELQAAWNLFLFCVPTSSRSPRRWPGWRSTAGCKLWALPRDCDRRASCSFKVIRILFWLIGREDRLRTYSENLLRFCVFGVFAFKDL